jgi:anaerobic selenocysteine-containing dehydrogenase
MVSRRDFMKTGGACGLLAGLPDELLARIRDPGDPLAAYPYREWEDFYRRELAETRGNAQGYAFHCSNCQGNCAFRVYAKDGVVTREEQLAEYPQLNPNLPDPNPRGCNKGTIHSQAMHEKDRLLHPLKRIGARGAGKWQRVSWDEALGDIAEKLVDTLVKDGPGAIMVYAGTGIVSQGKRAGPLRLGSLLGAQRLYPSSAVGDMFTGASLAYGIPNVGTSLDAWFEIVVDQNWSADHAIPDRRYIAGVLSSSYGPRAAKLR